MADSRTLTNRIPISSDAQKVVFEYEPIESSGSGNYFCLTGMSGENQNTGAPVSGSFGSASGAVMSNWGDTWAKVDHVYYIEVDMVNRTAQFYYVKNGETTKKYTSVHGSGNLSFSNETLTINHVGFSYGYTIVDADGNGEVTEAELDKCWHGKLKVRCYDDKGRDLQVCSMQGSIWTEGLTVAPKGNATLASFDTNDYLLDNTSGGVGEMAHGAALNVVDAKETGGVGASGGVLVISKPPQPATFAIQMGRVLTAEDVAKGGSLIVRLWSTNNNAYLYGCQLLPYDYDKCLDSTAFANSVSKEYFREIMNIGNQGASFVDLEIPNEDLLKFCDKDGNFKGFSFWMGAWDGAVYTVYIDDIFYKLPVNVNLFDAEGQSLGSKKVSSGYSLEEQFSVIVPDVAGKEFVGWTKTLGGNDYYDVNEIGYETSELNLYASYKLPVANANEYVGVYANEESGKYFQLCADGTVIDETGAIGYAKYKLTEGIVIFDDVNVATIENFVIAVDGVNYAKASQAYTVTYNVLGEACKEIIVPAGYKAIEFGYETTDFVFGGWKNGEQAFDFASVINEDVVLNADLVVNEIDAANYAEYENAYYSAKTGIIYIVKAPDNESVRKFIKIENGTVSEVGVYKITKSDKLFVNDKLYAFEPMKTSSSASGEKYVGPLEIIVDGVDYWIFNKTFTITVHYMDATNKVETFEVDAEDNFLFDKLPNPAAREGYTFKGWRLGDGQAYNFDSAVVSELEIYAVWHNNASYTAGNEDEGCGSSIGGSTTALICSVMTVAAVLILKRKKDGNNGKAN